MICVTLLQMTFLFLKVAGAVVPILQLCLKWLEFTVVHECCCFLLNTGRKAETFGFMYSLLFHYIQC